MSVWTILIPLICGAIGGLAGRYLAKLSLRRMERKLQDELIDLHHTLSTEDADMDPHIMAAFRVSEGYRDPMQRRAWRDRDTIEAPIEHDLFTGTVETTDAIPAPTTQEATPHVPE